MTTKTTPSSEDDQYQQLLSQVRSTFAASPPLGAVLFTTETAGLFGIFLDALPPDRRQHYDCNACRRFVDRFGGVVRIQADGSQVSVLWDPETAPLFFEPAVRALARAVTRSKVNGVFLCEERVWGLPKNDQQLTAIEHGVTPTVRTWHHLAVVPAASLVHKPVRGQTTAGAMSAEAEEHGMLCRGLAEFPIDVVRQAHTLLTSGQLYRSEKCVDAAKWLLDLHTARAAAVSSSARDNLTWLAAATAPAGFCHVRSTMIGTLLEDIVAKLPFAEIKRRFDEKMAPGNYQRAQAAPSAGNIAQAEKVIAEMKAAGSLGRRYATLDDLACLWRPAAPKAAPTSGGVFGHLTPKGKPPVSTMEMPSQTMTWEKFQRTVLPGALSIEVQVPPTADRFVALVTAADAAAPPILQWDTDEARNPVSWYYAAGIDAEIKRRVVGAGGRYDDVDIRASLIWHNRNDLDLHVVAPSGAHIFFAQKMSPCGGWLDVDMNVHGETDQPIENIRWAKGMARAGRYQVIVQNFRFHESFASPTPFKVELEVLGDVFTYEGVVSPRRETGEMSNVRVASFDFRPGQKLTYAPVDMRPASAGSPNAWGLTPNQWAKVTGVTLSPNMWGKTPMPQHGQHVFFLLDGCKDTSKGTGRGFFVETLRGELRPLRSTLEAYTATAAIEGADRATACGVGMTSGATWDLLVRVTTESGVATYKLDRWD